MVARDSPVLGHPAILSQEGLVHFLERQPYANGKLLTPKKQWIEFRDISKSHKLRDVYNHLTAEKRKRIRGSDGGGWVEYEEHREQLERQKKTGREEHAQRYHQKIVEYGEGPTIGSDTV